MTPTPDDLAALSGRSSAELLHLADTIIRAWELSSVPFDVSHQIQLAVIAARFVIASRNVEMACNLEVTP